MTSRRVRLRFFVQRITCPGVFLCRRSADVELTVSALNTHRKSQGALPPSFPMCVHETFTMERSYGADELKTLSADNRFNNDDDDDGPHNNDAEVDVKLRALSRIIANEPVTFTLWHCSRRLAHLTTNIARIQRLNNNASGAAPAPILLMTTRHFPGSIAPRLEVTAGAELVDTCACCRSPVTMNIADDAAANGGPARIHNGTAEKPPLSRWSFPNEQMQPQQQQPHQHQTKCVPPFTLWADFDERTRPIGMRQRPVCHGTGNSNDGNGINELYFRNKTPAAARIIDGIVCDRCQDRCSMRTTTRRRMSMAEQQQHEDGEVDQANYRWELICKDPAQSCCPHVQQSRPAAHQHHHLHDALSNTTLWLQQMHPNECAICTKYRTYFHTTADAQQQQLSI